LVLTEMTEKTSPALIGGSVELAAASMEKLCRAREAGCDDPGRISRIGGISRRHAWR
jgi:hypothetical protein